MYKREDIEQLHAQIPHGEKKKVAERLQLKPSALSRYLNLYRGRFQMPESVYNQIIEILNHH